MLLGSDLRFVGSRQMFDFVASLADLLFRAGALDERGGSSA